MASTSGKISEPTAGVLRISLFGAFSVFTPEGTEITISSRRARALLAMLCLSPGEALERDYLSKLLWPGRFQAQARASLRQTLLGLDKTLTPRADMLLDMSHSRVAIDRRRVETDLGSLERALAAGCVADACDLFAAIGNRPLLDQINLGDPFHNWLAARRQHVESRLQIAVDRALVELDKRKDATGREQVAEAWHACGRGTPLPRDGKTRIAILPFAQHDAVGGDFFLADGVVEELSFRLGEVPVLALIGRTSILSVTAGGGTLPEIAAALQVSYLIEGEVHRFDGGVRVNLRLIDGRSGTEIWSDRYDGTVADAIGSRPIIGSHFIAGLCAALGVEMEPTPARRMTTNRDAYALYLQGRALFMKTIGEDVIHPGDSGDAPLDPDFQGYARIATDAKGVFRFLTIKPAFYKAGDLGFLRTAHIHLDVQSKRQRLVTQLYFPAELDFLRQDKVLMKDMSLQGSDAFPPYIFAERVAAGSQIEPGAAHWRFDVVLMS